MLIPNVRRTWAPRGQTPIGRHRYRRDKISAISAVTVSPARQRARRAPRRHPRASRALPPGNLGPRRRPRPPRFVEREFREFLVQLKTAWREGPSPLRFEPIALLEKLAAITPRPTINVVLDHGGLAPPARWRSPVVRSGRSAPDPNVHAVDASPRGAAGTPCAWPWAALMRRVFDLDVLACPRCGGRLRVIATVQDPRAVQAILAHLARAPAPAPPGPAPPTSVAIG